MGRDRIFPSERIVRSQDYVVDRDARKWITVEKCNIVDIGLKNFKDKSRFKNLPIFRFIEIFTSVQKLMSGKTKTITMIIKKCIISNNYLTYFVQALYSFHIHQPISRNDCSYLCVRLGSKFFDITTKRKRLATG